MTPPPDDRPDLQPLDSAVIPRYADVATFMRLPRTDDLAHVDIGVFGIPLDTATFRGARARGRRASARRRAPSAGSTPARG